MYVVIQKIKNLKNADDKNTKKYISNMLFKFD